MRALVAVTFAFGCGRIAFDPLGDGGASHLDGDGSLQTCATTELCNGIDDTCDNVVDEGCGCTEYSIDTMVSAAYGAAYTGTGSLVLAPGTTATRLLHFDGAGVAQPESIPYPGQMFATIDALWTGSRFAVLRRAQFPTLSVSWIDGTGVGTPFVDIVLDDSSSSVGFGSRGEELAVVWGDSTNFWVQWFDGTGAPLSPRTPLSDGHSPTTLWQIQIASRTDGWAIAWADYHQTTDGLNHPHVAFFDNTYAMRTSIDLGGVGTTAVGITHTGNGYAFLGTLADPLDIVLFDPAGTIIAGPTAITGSGTTANGAKIGWTGNGFRGVWSGSLGIGSGIQVVTARLDMTGAMSNVEAISANIMATGGSTSVGDATSASGRGWLQWHHATGTQQPTMRLTQRCP